MKYSYYLTEHRATGSWRPLERFVALDDAEAACAFEKEITRNPLVSLRLVCETGNRTGRIVREHDEG